MSEEIEKVLKLGNKYINLQEEIAQNQQILLEYQEEINHLMRSIDIDEIKSEIDGVLVKREVSNVESFDSKRFKIEKPDVYEKFRFASKRFNQNKLKTAEPSLFKEYTKKETTENIIVERYIPEESLPSL